MKKIAILLLAILIFSCSDDDEKGTVENKIEKQLEKIAGKD